MFKKSLTQKVLAMALVFTLTFSNFAFVTKTYAASIFEAVFSNKGTTGSKDVEFEAYFKSGEEASDFVIADVNAEELKLYFDLRVLDKGYIKDGVITILEAEEGKGINFKVKDEFENEDVESFEDNRFNLVKISGESEKTIEIPIEYFYEDFIDLDKISKDFKVKFTGIYVNSEAKDVELEKEIILNVSWKDTRELNVESELTKFFEYKVDGEDYSILQTLIKIDTNTERKTLPIESMETKIQLPEIEGSEITNIAIVAQSTAATNNRENENVVFDTSNIEIDDENNTLVIKTVNEIQEVVETVDEILKETEEDIVSEKYFAGKGVDEYLITYTIKNLDIGSPVELEQNISTTVTTYNVVENEEDTTDVDSANKVEAQGVYTISETTGQNVSFQTTNETTNISKGHAYLNYNLDDKLEVEFSTKSIINISNHEFVEEINLNSTDMYYLQKDGNRLDVNDVFYKSISVSKENFEKILGIDGKIEVFDVEGNLLNTIDLSKEINEEYVVAALGENIDKFILKTTAPISEGNLNINTIKVQIGTNYDKETYKNIDSLNENIIVKVKYADAIELADIGNETITTKLDDTVTDINLVLNKESLSTLVLNTDVEFKIELNNHKVESDVFGNSVFEIEFPEYVRGLEITNTSIVYGEGLEISNVEGFERNGRIFARVSVSGKQNGLSSGIVTNGTNIVLTANILVDQYAPAKQEEIKLYYYNEEATNYFDEKGQNTLELVSGILSKTIEYSAPAGVVSVNNISNYNNENSNLVSINQGTKKDKIDIYSQSRNAKMELIVMNNNQNSISNIAILGRIPFEGLKDIISGEDLKNTVNSKLITQINNENNINFKIYYSQNGDANKDLNDSTNGWTLNIENLDFVKSFLIVPEDDGYTMETSTILRFNYEYLIPENLEHNENIISTFATYYTNNSEAGNTDEVSVADIVYLTTGVGPQFTIQTEVNTQKAVTEFEEFKITSKVVNTGKDTAYDVKITIPVPEGTSFINAENDENTNAYNQNGVICFDVESLRAGETKEVSINVKVNNFKETEENKQIEVNSSVQAKDLAKTIESEKVNIELKQAEIKVEIEAAKEQYFERVLAENSQIELLLKVKNLTKEEIRNVVATMKLDESYELVRTYIQTYEEGKMAEIDVDCFNNTTKVLNWNIGNIEGYNTFILRIQLKLKDLEDGITKKKISNIASAKADGTEEYTSSEKIIVVGGASLEIKQTTSTTDTYIKEGNKINYTFFVKNIGTVNAESVKLVDKIPAGLTVTNIKYTVNDITTNKKLSNQEEATVYTTITPGDTLIVDLTAVANNIGQTEELAVTNEATVTGANVDTVKSNSITHIIEATEPEPEHQSSNSVASSDSSLNTNLTKTYKISGTAWLDNNEDGMRDEGEERLSGISAMLVNSDTGVIKSKITTNSKGGYTFTNVENGKYIIIFDYDTALYNVTGYQKEGVTANLNSDVINTTIEQDGKQRIGAVTDVIVVNSGSISNIDMGLVWADTFDLKLENKINKITVQNSKGVETINFDNVEIAKTEIAAKNLAGSTVYIEYTIKVSNVGELAGYAKKIVDYLPEGLAFNSGLKGNEEWYTGSDGNLYSTSLADVNIAPGQSKEIKLVLTKQMTEENTGLISNTAEIFEDYNIYGISDKNSTAGNKIQNENDMATADIYIGIKTGEVFIYISVIITTALLGGIVIFIAYNKLIYRKRKVGV